MKKYLIIFVSATLYFTSIQAQFEIDSIRNFYLNFYDAHWQDTLDNYYINDTDLMVLASLTINGITYDSVGVRYKGNSSCSPGQIKNPFHIELDTIINQDFMGVSTFKLSNGFKDPSFVREAMSYEALSNYMACSKSNFVQLYADNQLIGLYTNNQTINKDFVENHFYSRENPRFKCDPSSMGAPPPPPPSRFNNFPQGKNGLLPHHHPPFPPRDRNGIKPMGFGSALGFIANDSTAYYDFYQLKSDYGWTQMNDLINILNNYPSQIESILDVDRALWMLAWNTLFANMDSYTGSGHNYYIYQNDSSRFCPIIWDLNETFGTFSSGLSETELKQLFPLFGIGDTTKPLIQKLLSNSNFKKRYLAHFKTLKEELIDSDYFIQRTQELQSLIDQYVQNDPNKLFTYTDFQNSLLQDIGSGTGVMIGIEPFLHDRKSYLDTLSILQPIQPTINQWDMLPVSPTSNDSVTIMVSVADANIVTLEYTTSPIGPFVPIQMLDNGTNGDTLAGDGIFSAIIPKQLSNVTVRFYIYAENPNAGRFIPARAEYETFSYTIQSIYTGNNIVINEFCAKNDATQTDDANEYDDWIELYNTGSTDIQMQNMYLTDDLSNLLKWQIPDTTIAANSFLIIWADNDILQTGLHANFKLSSGGEALALVNNDFTIADSVTFPVQYSDTTYGRYPNGTGNFQYLYPTFNANNIALGILDNQINNEFKIFPNPTTGKITIEAENLQTVTIFDFTGKIVFEKKTNRNISTIDITNFPTGMYFISIKTNKYSGTRKIIKY